MKAIILSVGDELALGQTVDTNSAWLSRQLSAVGVDVVAHATVRDDQPAIERAIRDAAARCDLLLISGGIGPTDDDLTRQALAAVLHEPLEPSQPWLEHLQEFFQKLDRPMPPRNRVQAMIPRGAVMMFNHAGTAAGIDVVFQSGDLKSSCRIFAMPGVPAEMKAMFAAAVLPQVSAAGGGAAIVSRTLHTFGLGESAVNDRLGALMDRARNPLVGTTVSNGMVSVRVTARFPSVDQASAELEQTSESVRAALGELVWGQDEQTLPQVLAELMQQPGRRVTVATAESCTGGLLAKLLTDRAGSSAHFHTGWVTYSNAAKHDRLGISENLINVYGAVSEQVVEAMAANARRLANAAYALAISGIAGPGGGSATKPVGTVCIALAERVPGEKQNSVVQKRTFLFPGDREMVRERSATMALTMLRFRLLDKPLPF
jgi:nicotinamide-nucleotide amidase